MSARIERIKVSDRGVQSVSVKACYDVYWDDLRLGRYATKQEANAVVATAIFMNRRSINSENALLRKLEKMMNWIVENSDEALADHPDHLADAQNLAGMLNMRFPATITD